MDTTKIEKDGIIALENFLSESNLLQSYISVGDKYPVWDGEILIYKIEDHCGKKENLRCRVPVQVKSKNEQWKETEDFRISRNDLKLYSSDGGVLLIRPIYLSTINYRIYAKALLPVDIYRLLRNSNNKCIAIDLKAYKNIQDFVSLLLFFNENKKHQYNFTEDKTDKYMKDEKNEVVFNIIAIKGTDPISLIFSNESFVYIRNKYDELLPTTLQLSELRRIKNESVKVNDKVYFTEVTSVYRKNYGDVLAFNSALSLRKESSDINFDLKSTDDTCIEDLVRAVEFMKMAEKEKHFFIGKHKINFDTLDFDKNNLEDMDIDPLQKILKFLKTLYIATEKISFAQYNKNSKLINDFAYMLIDGRSTTIEKNDKASILKLVTLFNKKLILFLENIQDNVYSCKNFMTAEINNVSIIDHKIAIPCSKYLGLLSFFKDGLALNIEIVIDYRDIVLKELFSMYLPGISGEYILFALECIKGYDISNLDEH